MNYEMYEFVRNYFRNNFPEYYILDIRGEKIEDNSIRKIIEDILSSEMNYDGVRQEITAKKFDYGKLNSAIDKRLNDYISEEERVNCQGLYYYIMGDKFTAKYRDVVRESIVKNMGAQIAALFNDKYDFGKIGTSLDEKIRVHYNEMYNIYRGQVARFINEIIVNDTDIYNYIKTGILVDSMKDSLTEDILRIIPFESLECLDKKNKHYLQMFNATEKRIKNYISRNKGNVKQESKSTVLEYIYNYLDSVLRDKFRSDADIRRGASFIKSYLVGECNVREEDILHGDCNDRFEKLINIFIHSEKLSQERERIRKEKNIMGEVYEPVIKKASKPIVTLLLIGTLLTFNGRESGKITKKAVDSHNDKIVSQIMVDDGYKNVINSDYMYKTSMLPSKIIDSYYNKYINYDELYDGVVFAEAYMNVSAPHKMVIMDKLLEDTRDEAFKYSDYTQLAVKLTGSRCFLEYMYECLENLGVDEINEEKYQILLNDYLFDRAIYYDDDNYEKRISQEDIDALAEVEEMYVSLYKKALLNIDRDITENTESKGSTL